MNLELGQMLWSGQDIQEHEAYWASDGLLLIGSAIEDVYPEHDGLGLNYGGVTFENDKFIMRNYCWCDGDKEGHEDSCPPNFVHKPTNLIISWYKHCGRGITANKELKAYEWALIVSDCINSLKDEND
jgi:hypothetical protein